MNLLDKFLLKFGRTYVSVDLAHPGEVVLYKMLRGRPHILGTVPEEKYYREMKFDAVYHCDKEETNKLKESK